LERQREYQEYFAWLQPGTSAAVSPVKLCGSENARFPMEECRAGLVRLFGNGAVREDAAFTVNFSYAAGMEPDAFSLEGSSNGLRISAETETGLLYGVYALLRRLALGEDPGRIRLDEAPRVHFRILNHWDNMDGSIERGYSGRSIFFRDGRLRYSEARVRDYARLLASVGVNRLAINNVNVSEQSAKLVTEEMLPAVGRLAALLRPFGIRLILAVHFESPVLLGCLDTADPLDARVQAWWSETAERIYRYVPDFAGFLVKADSEFRGGPASMGRTQADGANVIARAVALYGGTVYWRCFIYNCRQDWRDTQTDRPKAAYETFMPLDGAFERNVVLQIKCGPSDFQVREPLSPLLGAMGNTRQAVEFQITQEYTGQQIDLFALAVQWQEFFSAPVTDALLARDLMGGRIDSIAGVSNVGDDRNWTGHTLAQANLYAFGRMAWDPSLTARQVTQEWIRLTFGGDPVLLTGLTQMMLDSRRVYEKYCAPLGIGWMVSISDHYGPSVDGYEYMRWGTYHRADHTAIGVDRTDRGTGLTAQYHPALAALYNDPETCPQELLLFFHRLRYDYRLKDGRTLIQYIYDTHFEGAAAVEGFIRTWQSLEDRLPPAAYAAVAGRLQRQLLNAREWRDVVNTYFYRKTGIPDERGRKIYA